MATWKIDASHSEVQFKVKHLMITTVTGHFSQFNVEAETGDDNDFTKASTMAFSAEVDSISTNNADRDNHLKSADFFDAAKYPQILFKGSSLKQDGDSYKLTGDLTIKDVTRSVSLDAEFGGIVVDPYGQTKAGFTVTGKINRKDFGLTWSAVTEAGSIVVSDDVRISCEIQLVKQ